MSEPTCSRQQLDAEPLTRGFAAAFGCEPNDAIRSYVRDGHGAVPEGAWLLNWDANSVHGFVFDTTNPSVIRGASVMLSALDALFRGGQALGLDPAQVLYSGGGAGLAVVSERQVEDVERRLHQLFAEKTMVATCTAAAVPLGDGSEPFSARMRVLMSLLARRRGQLSPDAEPSVPFFAARCVLCGKRAAAGSVLRRGAPGGRLECEPCRRRIEVAKTAARSEREAGDFADLKDANGSYAIVYLDGNGIGRTIQEIPSPLELAAFSQRLAELLRTSFDRVAEQLDLREVAEEETSQRGKGRFQRPICGGDDLVALVPAEISLQLSQTLIQLLEEEADRDRILCGRRIGAGAGIAIGKVGFPARHLLHEAEELLKSAKRRVYRDGERSAVDFAVLLDGSPRSEAQARERFEAGAADAGSPTMLRSGKPYSLEELCRLTRRLEILRGGLGRSQLYALQRYGLAGPGQLRNHVLYQIARHESWRTVIQKLAEAGPEVLRDAEACLAQVVPTYGGRRVFDLGDLLEAMDCWPQVPKEAS